MPSATVLVFDIQGPRAVVGNQVQTLVQLLERHCVCQVNAVVEDMHHVAVAGDVALHVVAKIPDTATTPSATLT